MALIMVTEGDKPILDSLKFNEHFPAEVTDGEWKFRVDEYEGPIFELDFKKIRGFERLMLPQMLEDLNFGSQDSAYFVFFYRDDAIVLTVGYIDEKVLKGDLAGLQETVADYGKRARHMLSPASGKTSQMGKGNPS